MFALFARGLGKALLGAAIVASAIVVTSASAEVVLKRGFGARRTRSIPTSISARAKAGSRTTCRGPGLRDSKGGFLPGAAEKWEASDDGLTWTFHLRDGPEMVERRSFGGAGFCQRRHPAGRPKTASPRNYYFSSTIARSAGRRSTRRDRPAIQAVGITAPDDRTVVIKLYPVPEHVYLMGSFYMPPLHKPSFDKFGDDFIKPENIVNNGAYMMTEMVPQSHVTLVKNPELLGRRQREGRQGHLFGDRGRQHRAEALQGGRARRHQRDSERPVEALKGELGDQVRIAPYVEAQTSSFNIAKPPFDNIKVRQALALASTARSCRTRS